MISEMMIQYLDRLKVAQYGAKVVSQIPFPYHQWGVKVGADRLHAHTLDRFVALWLWKWGILGGEEQAFLRQVIQPGMHIVDIGANIGFYTLQMAKWVGDEGRVWAFEPDAGNFASLNWNIQTNHYQNITAMPLAVGARQEMLMLYQSAYHHGDHRTYATPEHRREIKIEATALDHFFAKHQHIDMIKMDIQGYEGLALQGMRRILSENPNIKLFMEFWAYGLRQANFSPEKVIIDLQDMGFTVQAIFPQEKDWRIVKHPSELITALEPNLYTNLFVER